MVSVTMVSVTMVSVAMVYCGAVWTDSTDAGREPWPR